VSGWTELTVDLVEAQMPTDMGVLYPVWLEENPAKATRLAEIVAMTVIAFRDAVRAQRGIVMDEGPTMIPTTGNHHAVNLVLFTLGMEMGVEFSPTAYNLNVQANIWLRMVQTGKLRPVPLEPTAEGTPCYRLRLRRCRRLSEVGRLE
jgi:hypothetical protein